MRLILLCIMLLLFADVAAAQEPYGHDRRWADRAFELGSPPQRHYRPYRSGYEWGAYQQRLREQRIWAQRQAYGYAPRPQLEADDDGPRCKRARGEYIVISREGAEAYDRKNAKENADAMWMEAVRNRFGVRYMDPDNSLQRTYECGLSATGNRASEVAADVRGKRLEQCTVEAVPCRAELEGAESAEPLTPAQIKSLERRGVEIEQPAPQAKRPGRILRRFFHRQ